MRANSTMPATGRQVLAEGRAAERPHAVSRRRCIAQGGTVAALGGVGVLGAACSTSPQEATKPGTLKTGITLGWHSNSAGRI